MKKIGDLGKIVEKIVEDAAKEDGENSSALSSDIMVIICLFRKCLNWLLRWQIISIL